MKPYIVRQLLASVVNIILFSCMQNIVKKLLQNRFSVMKNEEIIKLLSLSLEKSTLLSK